jgi:Uma2 family endonuclease
MMISMRVVGKVFSVQYSVGGASRTRARTRGEEYFRSQGKPGDDRVRSVIDLRILECSSQRERVWPLSVEGYHVLGEAGLIPEKTELLGGLVFRKTSKSPYHRMVLQRLLKQLAAAIDPTKCWLQSKQPLTCEDSEPEPDLAVIAGSNEDFLYRHPTTAELVIEIAGNSREMDRAKAEIYATAGVKEYWMVDVMGRTIEIRREPRDGVYQQSAVVGENETAESATVSGFRVDVAALLGR